jgi:hypothetical protein
MEGGAINKYSVPLALRGEDNVGVLGIAASEIKAGGGLCDKLSPAHLSDARRPNWHYWHYAQNSH